jgi:hypothetical protein
MYQQILAKVQNMRFQENVSGGSSAASCDKWTDMMGPLTISATDMNKINKNR